MADNPQEYDDKTNLKTSQVNEVTSKTSSNGPNGLSFRTFREATENDFALSDDKADDDKGEGEGDTSGPQTMVFSCPVDHSGTAVYVKGWVHPGSDKPPVLIVHDLGENIGLYREAAKALGDGGYSTFGFDLRGHGRSGRMLGHIPRFDSLVNDLLQVVNWIRYKTDRKVPILIGQGIGALITVYFQTTYPHMCASAVLVSPCLSEDAYMPNVKRFMIRMLAEMAPTMRLPRRLTPEFLFPYSHRKRQPQSVMRQPYHGITANFACELLTAIKGASDKVLQLSCPTLILCPKCDTICDYSKLYELISRHPRRNLFEVEELADAGHHVMTDSAEDLDRAVKTILPWLDRMTTASNKSIATKQPPAVAVEQTESVVPESMESVALKSNLGEP